MRVLPISILDDTLQAIRDGRQKQLRRPAGLLSRCRPGDCLWIRERFHLPARWDAFSPTAATRAGATASFAIDGVPEGAGRRRFARELPAALHRMHLRVLAARVEQIQDLTEFDAIAEGAASRADFMTHWNCVHARAGAGLFGKQIRWADNPRVVVLRFDLVEVPLPMAAFAEREKAVA